METKKFILKTKDNIIEYEFVDAHLFTNQYSKKLRRNEFHLPKVGRLIIETKDKIFNYLLLKPFIIIDEKNNVEVLTVASYNQLIQEQPYFDKEELKGAKNLSLAYQYKSALGLTPEEVVDKSRVDEIVELNKLLKKRIPHIIGGGF